MFATQNEKLRNPDAAAPPVEDFNSIDMVPPAISVQGTTEFAQKDFSEVKDLQTIEKLMDWSFSSPYKGTIANLTKEALSHITFFPNTHNALFPD